MTEKNDRIELDVDKYPNITELGVEKIEVLNLEKHIVPFSSLLPFSLFNFTGVMFVVYPKRTQDGYTDEAITLKTEEYKHDVDFQRRCGWSMLGKVHEDHFYWIEEFTAFNGYDVVFGNFLDKVFCSSLEALEDFLKNFEVERWDFYDI